MKQRAQRASSKKDKLSLLTKVKSKQTKRKFIKRSLKGLSFFLLRKKKNKFWFFFICNY
jgi:hypothetical protein